MPDAELLSLAERRRLSVPGVLDAQVTRMLADPKASSMADSWAELGASPCIGFSWAGVRAKV